MSIPQEVRDLIALSGNNFHSKVARWFQTNSWTVSVSPYYMDQTQNKAREIDLIAEKLWPIPDSFGRIGGHVAVRLFVECKFLPAPNAFWFTPKDRRAAENLVCSGGVFRSDNSYTAKHHYLCESPVVAKLFASASGRNQESEPIFKALNQVLNAMVSMRGMSPIAKPGPRGMRSPRCVLQFPVVVCSSFDQVYGTDFFSDVEPVRWTDNFQMEVEYAYIDRNSSQHNEYLLLDFVEFAQLNKFVAMIEEDARTAAFLTGD